jgi:hypothetical protein
MDDNRATALSEADIELILSALIYLKNMSLAIGWETDSLMEADRKVMQHLEALIKQFEEM